MNLMEEKLMNVTRTVRRNTRDINNNDLGQGLGGQASKSMFGKSMLGNPPSLTTKLERRK